ncbi:hypothetical protein C3433_12715 [Citrobacter freundii]|nr:hypothetical protein C3433_12715 [Citrobacter freundii]
MPESSKKVAVLILPARNWFHFAILYYGRNRRINKLTMEAMAIYYFVGQGLVFSMCPTGNKVR